VAEIVLAVMVTQMDLFNRLLGHRLPTAGPFGLALAAAVLQPALWEVGNLTSRRQTSATGSDSSGCFGASPLTSNSRVKRPPHSARSEHGASSRDPQHDQKESSLWQH
jgi:hypothetical protein